MKNPKILFTSVFKPFGSKEKYGKINGRHSISEMYRGQIMIAQDIFQLASASETYGLDLIAKNCDIDSTVLHYPSLKEFKKELKKGYTHVGINFVIATFEKAKIMSAHIRKNYPEIKIIFGGYGTVIEESKDYCDYLCKGEGTNYIRKLFNLNPITKFKQPDISLNQNILGIPLEKGSILLGSLGCKNGCDFCATSHFFKKKVHYILPRGEDIFNEIKRIKYKLKINNAAMIDEDFLIDKKRIMELSEIMSKSDMVFDLSGFASIKAINQYDVKDLVKCGINSLWVGIESFDSHFEKLKGNNIAKTLKNLQDHGITILGSFILGLEYHKKENLEKEFKKFLELNTDASQFSIYSPSKGTPLWKKFNRQNRLINCKNNEKDGFSLIFKHDNFTKKEMENILYHFYKKEYYDLGPSIYRYSKTKFKGYKKLIKTNNRYLILRANQYKNEIIKIYPILKSMKKIHSNPKIKQKISIHQEELKKEIENIRNIKNKILENIIYSKALIDKHILPKKIYYNPRLIIKEFPQPKSNKRAQSL